MESLATRLGGHRQRAPGEGPFPPGPTNLSIARTQQMTNDPLSLLLSNYERYGPIFSMRILYARIVFMIGPAANPLHHGVASAQLPLARGIFGDPDPAARRWPADDRRRLSRPRSPDHDARLPSRADRGGGRGDDERDRGRAVEPATRRDRRHLRLGAQPGDADRDARAARPRPGRRRPRRDRPSTSSARSASTARTTTCGSCAGRARPGAG